MTLVQKLDSALAELSIPFYPGYYEGNGKDYGVYDSITDEPAVFADDDNQATVSSCNVHLFVKGDKNKKKKQLIRLLKRAEFNVGTLYELYESETGYTHYIVAVESIGDDEEQEE